MKGWVGVGELDGWGNASRMKHRGLLTPYTEMDIGLVSLRTLNLLKHTSAFELLRFSLRFYKNTKVGLVSLWI